MKFLLNRLLLVHLWALLSWGVLSGTPVVTQTPDVSVMEWEAANITCCWTETFEKFSVNWLKNQTSLKSISKTKRPGSLQNDQYNCFTLTFTNITREDSGTYICRVTVEIPVYSVVEGNGTVITVTIRENTGDNRPRPTTVTDAATTRRIIIPETTEDADVSTYKNKVSDAPQEEVLIHIMRCLPVLALIITFFYLYNSGSKAQPHTPAAPENKPISAQRTEQDQEEEEKVERQNEQGEEENNAMSDD